jgi:hypothetical protein
MIPWRDKYTYGILHSISARNSDSTFRQLDDELISDLNIQEYRKQIALVSQEPVCFASRS